VAPDATQPKAHQPWRTRVCRLGFEQTHACMRAPVRARMRVCACMRAGARGGCAFGARHSHLFDLVPALKATDERRERPNQPQASRMKGAGTATAVALCRATPRPRAAGLLRHRNRVEAFGRRNSRRRGRRPCEAYGPPIRTGSARTAKFIKQKCVSHTCACCVAHKVAVPETGAPTKHNGRTKEERMPLGSFLLK
jgi:hypothetical protein